MASFTYHADVANLGWIVPLPAVPLKIEAELGHYNVSSVRLIHRRRGRTKVSSKYGESLTQG
jgi:hypothetical protein